jgi:hypothetical protein
MNKIVRRVSYVFLCVSPLVVVVFAGARDLRIPGVHQALGGVLFLAIVTAAWLLGGRSIKSGADAGRRLALAGSLLIAPWAVISLLWVGLGTPWDATPEENRMRYLVLLFGSIAVTFAFIVVEKLLSDADERFYSTLGYAANILAGAAYLVWTSFQTGAYVEKVHSGQMSPAVVALGNVFDILLFAGCVLTYLATAAFAASFGQANWLGRGAVRAYIITSFVALLFIGLRGLSFPDPTAGSTPWYTNVGFIAGIPAVPWIMPFLLGVVLLRRAGDERLDGAVGQFN